MKKTVSFVFAAAMVLAAVSFVTVHADNETNPSVGQAAPTITQPSQTGASI